MKFTSEQIIEFFNQAIENQTGIKGKLTLSSTHFDSYEVIYKSESDVTIIKILNTSIFMDDLQNETVTLGSKGENYNFEFYY